MQSDIILFGAKGDLSARKLIPSLYHLHYCKLLDTSIRIACIARTDESKEAFTETLKSKVQPQVAEGYWSDTVWDEFCERMTYICINFTEQEEYKQLSLWINPERLSLFYLATPPSLYGTISENLKQANCLEGKRRVVLEKPIGEDLSSSRDVNTTVARFFNEENIYRIDHYLGKETVQNLLVLRFANRFINAQWDQSCIDHIQITVAETVGIENRWTYYDGVGQLRDMVQNHLMQLLSLVAMEPPLAVDAESIRNEKVKVLKALRPITEDTVDDHVVRGQYSQGWGTGGAVPGYLQEEGCINKHSDTETFIAIKAYIDNWRWAGVPFYLRTGKRLPQKVTEIVISYKALPYNIFSEGANTPNKLVIRLQPNEGIEMQMLSKKQTLKDRLALTTQNLNLDFLGTSGTMGRIPDAYERLFLDAISGDQSLFVSREEVEESWRWCDGLIEACRRQGIHVKKYHAGSWGPSKSELLIEKDNRSWNA